MAARKQGRPESQIDREQFEQLCAMMCTKKEICAVLKVCSNTLLKFCRKTYKKTFEEIYPDLINEKKVSLRRLQWQAAESGNVSMLIWLGKCWLGQDGTTTDFEEPKDEQDEVLEQLLAEYDS